MSAGKGSWPVLAIRPGLRIGYSRMMFSPAGRWMHLESRPTGPWMSLPVGPVSSSVVTGDKDLLSHLRGLGSNKDAPYRYRCKTPWTKAHPNNTAKHKSPSNDSMKWACQRANKTWDQEATLARCHIMATSPCAPSSLPTLVTLSHGASSWSRSTVVLNRTNNPDIRGWFPHHEEESKLGPRRIVRQSNSMLWNTPM
jgi:hypothetical protein